MARVLLQSVSRSYVSGEHSLAVLDKTDLDIPEGIFAVVRGPSGSGKSTLLNIVGALDQPDSGTVTIGGADISALPERRKADFRNRTIGFVFQSFHLLPVLTATENVALPLLFRGDMPRRERLRVAREKLALVELSKHAGKVPGRLSGGERQRVAIARALACEPALILADEPTANLDRRTAQVIIDLMKDLNRRQGVTVLCATHDPLVVSNADQIISLSDGKLHQENSQGATHA